VEVKREDAVPLEEGEYFIEDLKGLTVHDRNSPRTGTLVDVITTGGVDILVISEEGKEKMMPFLNEHAGDVDLTAGTMSADFSQLLEQ